MAEITDIGNDRVLVKAELALVKQGTGHPNVCVGCTFLCLQNCPTDPTTNILLCSCKGMDHIWVEV